MKVKLNGNDWFRLTSEFGEVSKVHPRPHTGIDLAMPEGTPLYSPVDGIVSKIVDYGDKNVGKGILIKTEDDKTVILGHLSEFKANVGQIVHKGDLVALSGNTGRSTGSHLHLGLKDENGNFINPEPLLNDNYNLGDMVFQKEGIVTKLESISNGTSEVNFMDGVRSFGDFLYKWHETGSFWVAMYGKPFSQVMADFFKELLHDIAVFILSNSDLFFLAPAITFMVITFLVGKNKFTKWILPLWFFYFLGTFFHKMLL